jgi:2-dehydro-3-deoxy-D-gluconate 5-dehydrogenase
VGVLDDFSLDGKVALVTGAARGLGQGIALGLAEAGADVAVLDIVSLDETGEIIQNEGRRLHAMNVDLLESDAQLAADVVEECVSSLGRLDILVNNAGINIRKPVHELALDEWRRVLDTNLTSAYLCSKAAYPAFKAAGGGKIINIGSMMSLFGASFAPAYGASKGGIVQLTRSMAVAWARDNIQVNAVLPGWIDTELTRNARREVAGLHDSVLRRTPAGRWGAIDDMAGVAVFLASPASDFVTGTAIPVDGGYSVQG